MISTVTVGRAERWICQLDISLYKKIIEPFSWLPSVVTLLIKLSIEYNNNFLARDDIENKEITQNNLNQILILINDLDLVISYRILISEILIYSKLPVTEEEVNIEQLTTELSSIIATSKVNFENLPDIPEFSNHKNLVQTAITTAEDLHGRYLAALRNNEYDVANSISTAIFLNKETEIAAFEKSLEAFKEKSILSYEKIDKLP